MFVTTSTSAAASRWTNVSTRPGCTPSERERDRLARLCVDERSQPELELHQRPDLVGVVPRACDVVVDEPPNLRLPEEAARDGRRVEQDLARELAQRPCEPGRDGDAEPPLRPVEDVVRQPGAERVLEHLLRRPP